MFRDGAGGTSLADGRGLSVTYVEGANVLSSLADEEIDARGGVNPAADEDANIRMSAPN
jgi:hypothetical protein